MGLVRDVVTDAMKHLKVLAVGETPSAEDMAEGIRRLNLMMASWEGVGLATGWTPVSNPNDPLPSPPEDEEAIGLNLSIRMRAMFGASLDPDVLALAESTLAGISARIVASDGARIEYDLPGRGCEPDPRVG